MKFTVLIALVLAFSTQSSFAASMSCTGKDSLTGKNLYVNFSISEPILNLGMGVLHRSVTLCDSNEVCGQTKTDSLIIGDLPIEHVTMTALQQNGFAPYHHPGDISEYAKILFERPGLEWLATPGSRQRIEYWFGRINVSTQWVNWYSHQYVDCVSE